MRLLLHMLLSWRRAPLTIAGCLLSFQALIRDWRTKWSEGTGGVSDAHFPFGFFQLNSCDRAGEEESRSKPPHLIPTNWSYQNPKNTPGYKDPLGSWKATTTSSACTAGQPRGTPCRGQGDGFPSVRWAFTQSLALRNTFQAVIVDTPSAYGSVHSPFKQPAGSRLARAGLAKIYNLSQFGAVDPAVASVKVQATWRLAVAVKLRKLGAKGIEPPRAAAGFELLCDDQVAARRSPHPPSPFCHSSRCFSSAGEGVSAF